MPLGTRSQMTGLASHQQCRGCPQVACLPSRGPFLPGRPLVTVKQLFLLLLICYGLAPHQFILSPPVLAAPLLPLLVKVGTKGA